MLSTGPFFHRAVFTHLTSVFLHILVYLVYIVYIVYLYVCIVYIAYVNVSYIVTSETEYS